MERIISKSEENFEIVHFVRPVLGADTIYKIQIKYICKCPGNWNNIPIKSKPKLKAFCNAWVKKWAISRFPQASLEYHTLNVNSKELILVVSVNTKTAFPSSRYNELKNDCWKTVIQGLIPEVRKNFINLKNK